MNRKMLFLILMVVLMLVFPLVNTFIRSRNEYHKKYDFIISKVSITPTRQLEFYDTTGEKVSLWNYTVMDYEGVSKGDSIFKDKCSFFLYVYKKNNRGEFKEYLRIRPTGLFPHSMFCEKWSYEIDLSCCSLFFRSNIRVYV